MKDDIRSKLQDTPPEDQVEIAAWLVNRVATLSQTHRDSFTQKLDPAALRIFETA